MILVSTQKQYLFGLTQELPFDIFKMKKVTSHYYIYGPEITRQKTCNIKEINIRNQFDEKLGINLSLTTQ